MDVSVFKKQGILAFAGLVAITVGAGTMQAANVLNIKQGGTAITTLALTCNTQTGGSVQTISVSAATAPTTGHVYNVTISTAPGNGVVVTPSTSQQITNANVPITYTVTNAAGCVGSVSNTPSTLYTLRYSAQLDTGAVTPDASITVGNTVTVGLASGLIASGINITCVYSGGVWTPGAAQTVYVTSGATGGMPFALVVSGVNQAAAWVTPNPTTPSGTAGTTASTFTVAATAGCGGFTSGSHSTSLHLKSLFTGVGAPSPDLVVLVTMVVGPPSPLTVSPTTISLSHTKGSGTTQTTNITVTSSIPATYFTVNTATLPIWLTVNSSYGTAPASLTFSNTSVADTLPPGTYTATLYLQVYGYGDQTLPVTMFVTNGAPKLTISSANPLAVTWIQGTAPPTATITAVSSDSPIPYSVTTGGTLAPIVAASSQSGLAYSFGTNIAVTFDPQIYQTALPGSVITGTVSLTWGSPTSVTTVTINLTVASPGATVTSLSPATLPTASSPTTFPVVLSGAGFVASANTALSTKVGVVVGGVMVADSNFSANIVNPSSIILTISVPSTLDALLPFAPGGNGGTVVIGVCNGSCIGSAPTGTTTLTIGLGPVIQGVTSSSSFTEVNAPALPSVAAYDLISIFGVNFCSSVGSGCTTSTLLSGSPDTLTLRFPTFLSPDTLPPSGPDTRRRLTVTFSYPHGGPYTSSFSAPLLFANNNQINAIVPSGVTTGTADIIVGFNCSLCTPATTLNSTAFPVTVAASDPGIFTVGADGQGPAAALNNATYGLITSTNPAGARSVGGDSDYVLLYVTGLGAPDSTGLISTGSGCISATGTGGYEAALQAATGVSPSLSNIDGAIIQSKLLSGSDLPPCLMTEPTVKIGGVSITPTYAGFVADTVGGLYQIDIQLPASTVTYYPNYPATTNPIVGLTGPVQLPVTLTVGGVPAQSGVTMWVAPRLKVVAPTSLTLLQLQPYTSGNAVVATEGNSTYSYAVTSGVLPAGLTLGLSTGIITGTPGATTAGSYAVTVTATDTSATPLSGTVSFVITILGGLYVTSSAPGPFTGSTFGSSGSGLPTITAHGGTGSYTYAVTTSTLASAPTGMSATGGVFATTGATPAGKYQVTVTADDTATPPVTGSFSFTDTIALLAVPAATTNTAVTSAGGVQTVTTITVTGYSGTSGAPLTCSVSDTTNFSCADSGGTVTLSTTGTTLTVSQAYPVTVTVTDTATAAGALTGSGNYATATTATITVTPGS